MPITDYRNRTINFNVNRDPGVMHEGAQKITEQVGATLEADLQRQRMIGERRVRRLEQLETRKDLQVRRAVGERAWTELETLKQQLRAKTAREFPSVGRQAGAALIAAVRSGRAEHDAKARALGVDLELVRRINLEFGQRIAELQRPKMPSRLGGVYDRRVPESVEKRQRQDSAKLFKPPFAAGQAWNEVTEDGATMAEFEGATADPGKGVIACDTHLIIPGDADFEQGWLMWNGALQVAFETPADGFPQAIVSLTPRKVASLFYLGVDTWGWSHGRALLSQEITATWLDPFNPENTQAETKTLLHLEYNDDLDYTHDAKSLTTTQIVQFVGSKPVKAGTNYVLSLALELNSFVYGNDYSIMAKNTADWQVDKIVAFVD